MTPDDKNYKKKKKYEKGVIFTLIFILISIVLFLYSLLSTNDKVINNIKELGSSRINGFSTKIDNVINLYEILINMVTYQYETMYEKNIDREEIHQWLKHYNSYLSSILNMKEIQSYSVIKDNGSYTVFADEAYDLNIFHDSYIDNASWYKNAINNKGQVVFSDVYRDVYDNRTILTVSSTIFDGKGVLGLDIDLEDIAQNWMPEKDNLDNSLYILLDSNSNYIACNQMKHSHDINDPIGAEFKNNIIPILYKKIEEISNIEGFFKSDLYNLGEYYIFYKKNIKTGFISIVALNSKEFYLKSHLWQFRYIIILLILATFSIMLYTKENYFNKKISESKDVIDMLGNSYYAIFRVNIETEEYNIVRSSPRVSKNIDSFGKYSLLYNLLIEKMDKQSAEEFKKSFSMENIKKSTTHDQLDYGVYLHRLFKGEYRWINLRIIIDKSVSEDSVLLCFKECEEERKRELAHIDLLEDAISTLKESAEAKRILYSSVSHDMRTPLNGIIGIAELMEHHIHDPEKLSDYLEKIKIAGNQLITLVNNFLETAKSESKALETNIETFSLNKCVGDVINIFTLIAQRDKKHFSSEINITSDMVKGDLNKLMHILNNILSNAFKYTNDFGHILLTVKEMVHSGFHYYEFIIKDDGIGMSEEFLHHLWTPFTREKRDTNKKITGTGLGLSIVKSQVEHMKGEITIKSKYEKGTEVKITLPFEVSNQHKEEVIYKPTDIIDLAGLTILVAEDNIVNMQIVVELLSLRKIKVVQAWNGDEAVNIFKQSEEFSIDAILMDIQMPVMDGLEATKFIRNLNRKDAKIIPIIALSANIFEEDIKESMEAGMNTHLAKPINLDILYSTLSDLIKKSREHHK